MFTIWPHDEENDEEEEEQGVEYGFDYTSVSSVLLPSRARVP